MDKVYTNFYSLNAPEEGIKCSSFKIVSIDSLLVYESNYFLQVYLDSYTYKIVNTQLVNYFGDCLFESDKN